MSATRGHTSDLDHLRLEGEQCVHVISALQLFSCGLIQTTVSEPDARTWIASASRSQLTEQIRRCGEQVQQIRDQLGAAVQNEVFLKYFDEAIRNRWMYVLHPKWFIRRLFTKLDMGSEWSHLPEHTLVRLYLHDDNVPAQTIAVEWLEENAYSDMTVAWNRAFGALEAALKEPEHSLTGSTGPLRREHVAMVRLTIQSALHFLEAFLNGAAMHWLCLHETALEPGTVSLLMEWDYKKKRPQYLSLRDKLLKYSQVFAGSHPPKVSAADSDLHYVAGTAIPVRHALVHVSSRPSRGGETWDLRHHRQGHRLEVARDTVDA